MSPAEQADQRIDEIVDRIAKPSFVDLKPEERQRTYYFPQGEEVTFRDVTRLAVSERGTHRLETKDGSKHIVPTGWLYLSLDVDAWTL